MLTTNDKEDIHISYLSAVCASASVSFDLQRHDDDSTAVSYTHLTLPTKA